MHVKTQKEEQWKNGGHPFYPCGIYRCFINHFLQQTQLHVSEDLIILGNQLGAPEEAKSQWSQ